MSFRSCFWKSVQFRKKCTLDSSSEHFDIFFFFWVSLSDKYTCTFISTYVTSIKSYFFLNFISQFFFFFFVLASSSPSLCAFLVFLCCWWCETSGIESETQLLKNCYVRLRGVVWCHVVGDTVRKVVREWIVCRNSVKVHLGCTTNDKEHKLCGMEWWWRWWDGILPSFFTLWQFGVERKVLKCL